MPAKQYQITARDGRAMSTEQWAHELGMTRAAVLRRVKITGCPLTKPARTKPLFTASDGRKNTIDGWARELGISYNGVRMRLRAHGCPLNAGTRASAHHISVHALRREWWVGANEQRYDRDTVCQRVVRGMGPMLYEEIGLCLGLSRHSVAAIERRALTKYRQALIHLGEWNDTHDLLVERVRLADERRHWALEGREEE